MNEKLEQIALLTTSILSILVALGDFSGVLASIPWLSERIPTFSLLLLGVMAGYLSLERRGKLEKIENVVVKTFERIATLENRYSQVNAFFNVLSEEDHFAEIALIYGLRGTGKLLSGKTVEVESSDALELWRDCIQRSKQWFGVAYTKPDQTWYAGWGETIAQSIQRERISVGGIIKRVFVVDNESEYEQLRQLMKNQEEIGIEVRWITKDELLRNSFVSQNVKVLQTLDFAIIDNSWVFRTFRDKSRQLIRGEAIKDREITEKAGFVFTEAFNLGKLI